MSDSTFYGLHACEALARVRPDAVQRAFVTERTKAIFGPLLSHLAKRKRPYRLVEDDELERIAGSRHHEGVCLVADPIEQLDAKTFLELLEGDQPARLVFLDGVENPHNVGAILRSCAHFGAAALAGLADDLPTPAGATARVAQGAVEAVPMLRWPQPKRALDRLRGQGFNLVATVVSGGRGVTDLYDAELSPRTIFLIGAEHSGLGPSALQIADQRVTIRGTGDVESLNVAAATAVLLAEHARRFRA